MSVTIPSDRAEFLNMATIDNMDGDNSWLWGLSPLTLEDADWSLSPDANVTLLKSQPKMSSMPYCHAESLQPCLTLRDPMDQNIFRYCQMSPNSCQL